MAEEQVRRIRELKEKLIEAIDFCNTWEEIERKKKSATPPETQ
jgi:hypothetical protein